MDVFRPISPEQGANVALRSDPRQRPTPDYGTFGPGSDFSSSTDPIQRPKRGLGLRTAHLIAVLAGVLGALVYGAVGRSNAAWSNVEDMFTPHTKLPTSAKDSRQLDGLKPQKQAEALLELALGHSDGAVDQISSRVDHWQGKVQWSSQIENLTTAALNSDDMRVRESGIEVELAAYGLAKNSASLDYLLKTAQSQDHAQRIWALWALGLMANRGVQSERVVNFLIVHLQDSDADSRRWAVEGLALTGSDQAMDTILKVMHDDASPMVRERAACSLAESGMFSPQQRASAIPGLLMYTDDPSLDAQTHAWAFQALGDITHRRLPNDSRAWREWYAGQ
jgi:hypothetical protein